MTYPTIMPALTLDFQNSKQLDPRVTLSRSSSATYINSAGLVVSAAEHEARFNCDPLTGESLGLLIEEARTNLLTYSSDTTNAAWSSSRSDETIGGIAPDGSNTANDITVNGSGFNGSINQTKTLVGTHAFSVFVKKKGFSVFRFGFTLNNTENVYWNIDTDTFSNQGANIISASSAALSDGWYRISLNFDIANSASYAVQVFPVDNPGNTYTTVNGTDGFYLWGAQLEAGSFPTSYIPTAGTTATRAVDVVSITGTDFSSWYNQSEGTVYAEVVNMTSGGANSVWSFDNNTSNQRIMYRVGRGFIMTGYGSILTSDNPLTAKHAYGFKASDYGAAKDGSILSAGAPGSVLPTVDRVHLGTGPAVSQSSGNISRLSYYNQRLTDVELQALTL